MTKKENLEEIIYEKKPTILNFISDSNETEFFKFYNKRERGKFCEMYVRYWISNTDEFKLLDIYDLNNLNTENFKFSKSNLGGIKVFDNLNKKDFELDGIYKHQNRYFILEVKSGEIQKSSIKQFEKLNMLGKNMFKNLYTGLFVFTKSNSFDNLKDEKNLKIINYQINQNQIKENINLYLSKLQF